VNGVEQERLKQAVERLIDAQLEALDVIAERAEPNVEDLEEDDQALVCVHSWERPWRSQGHPRRSPRRRKKHLGGEGVAS
jgi:hypothetical protein